MIFAKINEKIHDVVSIDIKYSADDLKGHKIGWRKVNGTLEKKVGGSLKRECVNVLYFVRDTDECTSTYPGYAHNCHSSAHCVNVPQGFECECPIPGKDGHLPTEQQQFGVKGSGSIKASGRYGRKHTDGKCWGHVSTHAGVRWRADRSHTRIRPSGPALTIPSSSDRSRVAAGPPRRGGIWCSTR